MAAILHELANATPWGCLAILLASGLAFVLFVLPLYLQLRFRAQHADTIKGMTDEQRSVYRSTVGPGPVRHTGLVLLVLLGAGLLAGQVRHYAAARHDAQAQQQELLAKRGAAAPARRCDPPCDKGQECRGGKCVATATRPPPKRAESSAPPIQGLATLDRSSDRDCDPADDRWKVARQ